MSKNANSALRRLAVGVAAFVILVLVALLGQSPTDAWALPVYARKYKTSCQTCHTVFPRLTPIGEAFRMNGHRFPECDGSQVKEEPVALGAEAYKELFPMDAVYPGELPGTVPFALVAKLKGTVWQKDSDQTSHFAGFNPWFDLYFAGAAGENISAIGKFQVNGPSCPNCHSWAAVNFQVVKHMTIKVGRFQPEYFGFHQQPFYEFHEVFGPQRKVGADGWNFGKDLGVETAGIIGGRLRLVGGVMEGQDDFNQPFRSKNGFLRAAYKIGGMRMDGASEAGYTAPTKNWRDRSLLFGVLGYLGSSRIQSNDAVGALVTVDDRYGVLGGDFNLLFDDWTLFGGAYYEKHGRPTGTDTDIWAQRTFGGVRYFAMPWLVPSVNFDYFNSELPGDYTYGFRPRLDVLVRANVKVRVDATINRPVGEGLDFRNVGVMLDVGL